MAAVSQKVSLSLSGRHSSGLNQPAQGHSGTSSSPGFAMNVHSSAAIRVLLDELNRRLNIIDVRVSEVDSGHSELFDVGLLISRYRSTVLLTGIHDTGHIVVFPLRNIFRVRQGTDDDILVNAVPPIPPLQHARV